MACRQIYIYIYILVELVLYVNKNIKKMMATATNPFNLDFYVCIIVMKLDMKNGAK